MPNELFISTKFKSEGLMTLHNAKIQVRSSNGDHGYSAPKSCFSCYVDETEYVEQNV